MIARIGGNDVHYRAANRLLKLCRDNGGVYIKIGQHLVCIFQTVRLICQDSLTYWLPRLFRSQANLDYLIPQEYIEVLSSLFDAAPLTGTRLV